MALELRLNLPCGDPIYPDALECVNDLPGVTIQTLSQIADSDLEIATNLHYKLCRAAESMLKNDFLLLLGRNKRILAVTESTYKNVLGVDTTGNGYIEFTKYNLSPYIKIRINTLIVKFLEAGTITVITTDCGVETSTDYDVVVGVNHIPINYQMKSETGRVEFTTDLSFQTGYSSGSGSCQSCRSNCSNFNIDYNIGFNIMSEVDQDAIIDMYKNQLAYPHKLAYFICLMQEIIMTDRISYFCDLTREKVETIFGHYKKNIQRAGDTPGEYGLYDTALYNLVKGIEDSFSTGCTIEEVKCDGIQIIQTC